MAPSRKARKHNKTSEPARATSGAAAGWSGFWPGVVLLFLLTIGLALQPFLWQDDTASEPSRSDCAVCQSFTAWADTYRAAGESAGAAGRLVRVLAQSMTEARDSCRRGGLCPPSRDQTGTGTDADCGPGDDLKTDDRAVAAALDHVNRFTQACLGHACPVLDCDGFNGLRARLDAADQAVAVMAALPPSAVRPRGAVAETALGRAALDLSRTLRDLPRATAAHLVDPDAAPADLLALLTARRDEAAALALRIDQTLNGLSPPGASGTRGLWRVRLIGVLLDRLVAASETALAVKSGNEARAGSGVRADWQAMGTAQADVLKAVLRLEHDLTAAPIIAAALDPDGGAAVQTPACAARMNRAADMAARISRARVALSQCAVRAACPAADNPPGDLATGLDPLSDAARRLDVAIDALPALAALDLREDSAVSLVTDRTRYRAGEAMRVTLAAEAAVCTAEPGAWLGVLEAARPDDAAQGLERGDEAKVRLVARRSVTGLGLQGAGRTSVLLAAPDVPGTYDLKTFAPEARGGAETAAVRIDVDPSPDHCDGFTGIWRTNFGTLRMVERDGIVRGSYRRSPDSRAGFLTGRVDGTILTGHWESELGRGGTRMILERDGQGFRGTWSHLPDSYGGNGPWSGACAFPPADRQE